MIEESEKLKLTAAIKRYDFLKNKISCDIGLIHGSLSKNEKDQIMEKFIDGNIKCIISTTVIEVGIDNPNANTIVIENAERFGLAHLHQLRGRVGRGKKQGTCILLFKDGLSKNAIKRIKILKESDDGFFIAEEDLRLRGFGDLIGFQQSGMKNFRFADPVIHEDLFKLAEKHILNIRDEINQKK